MPTIRGRLLTPTIRGRWIEKSDATIEIGADGKIHAIRKGGSADEDWRPHLLFPGFVDAHAHVPQHSLCGVRPNRLLPWLHRSVFPLEAADHGEGAEDFFREAIGNGTTAGAFYSSAWPDSADACRAAMGKFGILGWIGMPLMDLQVYREDLRDLPLRERTRRVLRELEDQVRRDGVVRTAITPRFALSCSPELLEGAGAFPNPVQTHISEQRDEVRQARRRGRDYLALYERAGLLRKNAIFAHGIWLTSGEWRRLRKAGAAIAHCPTSNLFLGSGVLDWKTAWRGRVALGSDVGAGPTLSMYDVMRTAWCSHLARWGRAPSARQLLEAATVGGARAIDAEVGTLEPGSPASLQVLDADTLLLSKADSQDDVLSRVLHRGGRHAIRAVYVAGRRFL